MIRITSLAMFGAIIGCTAVVHHPFTSSCNISDAHQNMEMKSPLREVAAHDTIAIPTQDIRCQQGMTFVSGKWCTSVKQVCAEWMDPDAAAARRCKRFLPSECVGNQVHKEFCIETTEHVEPNETLPTVYVDTYQAKNMCMAQGKRLCKESEWIFACEGEEMNPYATGLERPDGLCNIDIVKGLGKVGHLTDHRMPVNTMPGCQNKLGIEAMNGNVDEITVRDVSQGKYSIALHSGWWGPIRARCRPSTVAHSEIYSDAQLGFRCCEDANF